MSATSREPLVAVSLVDQVTARVRTMILSRELQPGQRFSITDLASDLGVSHIPVREALRTLESEGLLAIRAGLGAWVRPLAVSDIRGMYRLRRAIEPALARLSAPLLTPEDLDVLGKNLGSLIDGDLDAQLAKHNELHFTLLRPAASDWDLRVLGYLWTANLRYARLLFEPAAGLDHTDLEARHHAIVQAARSRSPEQLEEAVRRHLDDNERALLAFMDTMEPAEVPG